MFGGEGNIPDSVKDAMLLKDYGSGKPLTARRIMEVYKAIEALECDNIFYFAVDPDHELSNMAFSAGYTKLDFGKLNTAANFLMKSLGMDSVTALGDKFCAYLEKNGPAALHVADGKNVDLNWIYREVIG